jgi:hypothetical protein
MKSSSFVKTMLAVALATQAVAPAAWANGDEKAKQAVSQSSRRAALALSDSQKLALNLMIAATMLDQQGVSIARVDESINKKYMYIKQNSIDMSLTGVGVSVAGGATYYSSKQIDSVLNVVTVALRACANGIKFSSEVTADVLKAIGVVWAMEKSVKGSEFAYEHLGVKYVLEWSSKKGVREFLLATTALSSAGTSVMYLTHNTNQALSYTAIRKMLGQEEEMRKRVDGTVETLSSIFNLSAAGQDKLKLAIYDEVLKQAVANKFSDDASKYSLDVIDLMLKNQLIDKQTADAVVRLRGIAAEITPSSNMGDIKSATLENVDMALALAALLDQQIQSQTIRDAKTLRNIQTLLGSVHAKLSLIGFNLEK